MLQQQIDFQNIVQQRFFMNRLQIVSKQIGADKKFQKIQLKVCPQTNIGFLTLNSPKDLNSLSELMTNQIYQGLKILNQNQTVNAIVIRSSHPKIFCAGADIKRFIKYDYEFYIRNQITQIVEDSFKNIKKPVIAAVNGKAFGGGFQLALLSDIIIASQNAYFGLPEVNLGLMPGIGGTQRLTKIIGQKMALRYILTADGFDGKKANQMNVCQLVKSQNFDENVMNIVKKITEKAVSTMIITKRAVKFASQSNLSQGLQFQKSTFYPLFATKAAKEGLSAFIQKRKPNFKGL